MLARALAQWELSTSTTWPEAQFAAEDVELEQGDFLGVAQMKSLPEQPLSSGTAGSGVFVES